MKYPLLRSFIETYKSESRQIAMLESAVKYYARTAELIKEFQKLSIDVGPKRNQLFS
jgi:hypothetical protein